MTAPNPRTGIALALVCLGLLSLLPILSNSRPGGSPALGFAFYLSVWQALFALPYALAERAGGERGIFAASVPARERRRVLWVGLATGAMFGAATWAYVLGVERAGAVSAAIAIQSYPLFAILVEWAALGRRKSRLELAFTALLLATLTYLGTGGSGRITGLSPWFLVALAVPVLWAVAHVTIKEELGRTPITPAQVTLLRTLVSTLFLGSLVAVVEPASFAAGLAGRFQLFALLMGLVYTAELIVWFHAVRHIDVSFASSLTTPWPAFTMVLAALVLGEAVAGYQIAAFLIVGLCIWGLVWAGARKARAVSAAR